MTTQSWFLSPGLQPDRIISHFELGNPSLLGKLRQWKSKLDVSSHEAESEINISNYEIRVLTHVYL